MKSKTRRFLIKLNSYFKEYCRNTSIHGFRYFGEKRTSIEIGWWLFAFLMCLSCLTYFIIMVYNKWENSPVIVSFATRETPIHQIPFPAVTICPETKSIKKVYNHGKIVAKLAQKENISDMEFRNYSYMSLMCEDEYLYELYSMENENETFHNMSFLDNSFYSQEEFFDFLFKVSPIHLENFRECEWMSQQYSCYDLFKYIITDEGICVTFNALNALDIYRDKVAIPKLPPKFFSSFEKPINISWNLEDGYTNTEGVATYPRRALYPGAKNALYFLIRESLNDSDDVCKTSMQGFKVAFHTPGRIPRFNQHYFRLPLNQDVMTVVQPTMITTSNTVKGFSVEKRQCYFKNEKYLKYFKVYSQKNCEFECLTNFTLEICGCVAFFMPRLNRTDICGVLSKRCMDESEKILLKGNLEKTYIQRRHKTRQNFTDEFIDKIPKCDCLPLCTDLSYNMETTSSAWEWRRLVKIFVNESDLKENSQIASSSLSMLSIYFENSQFVTSKRHELYGPTDFLGNFGGMLGLFTGFSMLSLMEIVYFLTIRIFCNIRLYGNWSGNGKENEKDVEKNL